MGTVAEGRLARLLTAADVKGLIFIGLYDIGTDLSYIMRTIAKRAVPG